MARRRQPNESRVIAYTRVSSEEQARSGLGLAAQRAVLEAEGGRRGWQNMIWLTDDGYSAKDLNRPGITSAIEHLRAGEASVLAVAKLDRLSRSLFDFAGLMAQSRREGWAVVCLDLGVDTSTPQGEMTANIFATFAQFERSLISQRTKDALAQKKATGARLGRPRRLDDAIARRIYEMRMAGASLGQIMHTLNGEGVTGGSGGVWRRGSVLAAVRSWELDLAAAAIREATA